MADYTITAKSSYRELAKKMEKREIVKAVYGDYVIYRRDWLQENIEQEYILQKSVKDLKPIKDGIQHLREFLAQQEGKGIT